MKKKILAIILAAAMLLTLAACASTAAPSENQGTSAETPASGETAEGKTYVVGICQLAQHVALDAATQGFKDALVEELGDAVTFEEQNASGDIPTCSTICTGFAASNVDLILANATPALQAAVSATQTIPILGTAVTEYGVALGIDNFSGTVGGNISGTSDLAPLDQQAAMITELFPDAKNVGIIYCSGEPNSVYQADVVKAALEKAGCTVTIYTFADTNDVVSVTGTASDANDVLYVPTDNTAASCAEAIKGAATKPIVAGEEGICKGCGVATLSIDYYELGRTTGEMAVKILKGEADISTMAIEYYPNPVKKYNPEMASLYNLTIPSDYAAIG